MTLTLSLVVILFCCLIIWKASDGFETASEFLGRNLSEGVRGATINAIGSSIPELFTTLFFLLILHNQEGLSGGIGTTAGSAIFNAMVIPSTVLFVVTFAGKVRFVKVSKKVIFRDGIMLLGSEFILIYLLSSGTLYWWHGLILMLLYGAYVLVMFSSMKKTTTENKNNEEEKIKRVSGTTSFWHNLFHLNLESLLIGGKSINTKRAWALLLLSTLIVGISSALLVLACEQLGTTLNIPVYFVAVILAAAATSVPDTVLSIKDAQKGNYDDAISNALGSNIFDICFALGFPLFLYTIIFNPIKMEGNTLENTNELRILLFLLTTLVLFIFLLTKKLRILQGFFLFFLYIFFSFFVLGKSLGANWVVPISDFLHRISIFLT